MIIGYIVDDTLDRSDGVQQAVLTLGAYMSRLGHEVHYIVADTARKDIKNVHSIGSFFHLSFNGNSVRTPKPASREKITQLFSEVQFDVLHVQLPCSPLLAGRVIRQASKNTTVVGTFHILPYNGFARWSTKLLGKVLRPTLKRIDRFYAVSKPALDFMQVSFSVSGSVLPNPVHVDFYAGHRKQKQSKKQVVFVGRFDERKGVRELIEAYSHMPDSLQAQTRLTMIGAGPLFEYVKQRAQNLGVEVVMLGFAAEDEKAQALANADVAVFPSLGGESFGIVLVEAMAAKSGVVIGGSNPGYASVLESWPETLFDPKNPQEFARTLQTFLTDDALRASIGASQSRAVSQYSVSEVAKTLLEDAYKPGIAPEKQNRHF